MQQQAMVNSATPAWKNAPLKSPFVKACVFFRNPSVLSEFDKSADAQTMFGTCSARTPSTVADALRVGSLAFCWMEDQSIFGAAPLNHSSCMAAFSGLASAQAFSSA